MKSFDFVGQSHQSHIQVERLLLQVQTVDVEPLTGVHVGHNGRESGYEQDIHVLHLSLGLRSW